MPNYLSGFAGPVWRLASRRARDHDIIRHPLRVKKRGPSFPNVQTTYLTSRIRTSPLSYTSKKFYALLSQVAHLLIIPHVYACLMLICIQRTKPHQRRSATMVHYFQICLIPFVFGSEPLPVLSLSYHTKSRDMAVIYSFWAVFSSQVKSSQEQWLQYCTFINELPR